MMEISKLDHVQLSQFKRFYHQKIFEVNLIEWFILDFLSPVETPIGHIKLSSFQEIVFVQFIVDLHLLDKVIFRENTPYSLSQLS